MRAIFLNLFLTVLVGVFFIACDATQTLSAADPDPDASVLTEPEDPEDGAVEIFFEEMQSLQGDALGTSRSGLFEVFFNALNYSDSCDPEFIELLGFYTDGAATTTVVDVTQNDGVFIWDDQNAATTDFAGAINVDGSFTLFDGDFVDENNYTYTLYQGSFADDAHFSGALLATIVMDGESLKSALVGACTVTTTFSGEILSE